MADDPYVASRQPSCHRGTVPASDGAYIVRGVSRLHGVTRWARAKCGERCPVVWLALLDAPLACRTEEGDKRHWIDPRCGRSSRWLICLARMWSSRALMPSVLSWAEWYAPFTAARKTHALYRDHPFRLRHLAIPCSARDVLSLYTRSPEVPAELPAGAP